MSSPPIPEYDDVGVSVAMEKLIKKGKVPKEHFAKVLEKVTKRQLEPLRHDRKGEWKVVLAGWRAIVRIEKGKAVVETMWPRGDDNY